MVLVKQLLIEADGIRLEDVRCARGRESWSPPEPSLGHAVVFVRRGCFRRRVEGEEAVVDPAVAYFEKPRQEQQVAHPLDGGDVCTTLTLPDRLLAWMTGGDPLLPDRPVFTDPSIDLAHRVLVNRAGAEPDRFEAAERAVVLVAELMQRASVPGVASGRPGTVTARRRAVDDARQSLMSDPRSSLVDLARAVAVSPHHLSRIFRAHTGQTLSRYRNRLRVRLALERLAEGERDLAALAADLGFADHGHLDRVVRREAGATPSALRSALCASAI
jgi:AraC-like DNA-binding protein